jgi:hypothetical protein
MDPREDAGGIARRSRKVLQTSSTVRPYAFEITNCGGGTVPEQAPKELALEVI